MAKKTLSDYVMGVRKEHEYTVRICVSELPDNALDRIENNLKQYDLIDVTKPKKTIFQSHPLGFAEPMNSEVFIFNVTLGLPASHFYLGREIAKILKVTENRVVVNCAENPIKDHREEYKAKLSTDPEYPEDKNLPKSDELYGTKYNDNMLKTILKARDKDADSITSTKDGVKGE
jgi:hypothetical protein